MAYTWVDGTFPGYQEQLRRFTTDKVALNPERFRDPHQLLRHSLRSLERHCPWVRTVTLFTARPQVPAWLRVDHPRLRIVHHDEVIPARYLPTFSCNAIESFLPALARDGAPFLYLNDDFLFGRATTPADFYAPDGRIRVFGSLCGERLPFRIYDGRWKLLPLGPVEHAPILVDPALHSAALALHPAALERTRSHRFRQPDDLRIDFLYRYYLLSRARNRAVAVPAWQLLRFHRFAKLVNDPARLRAALDRLRALRPRFYCLNDDQGPAPDPAATALIRDFLRESYPDASSFESPSAPPLP